MIVDGRTVVCGRTVLCGRNRRGQRGAGTVLAAAAILVIAVVATAVLVIAGYLAAEHHARAAADLVALSAASQHARGLDACRVARRMAGENKVVLAGCQVRGDSLDFVVTVRVEQRVTAPSVLLPDRVSATAHAGWIGLLR